MKERHKVTLSHFFSKSFQLRAVSGLVLAPLTLFVLLYGSWLFAVFIAAAAALSVYEFFRLCAQEKRLLRDFPLMLVYTALCFSSFIYMRYGLEQGAWLVICTVLCVWASDIGAYFVGKAIGGPRLAPVISPKKTVSGLAGAMFFCGLALVLLLFIGPLLSGFLDTGLDIQPAYWWAVFLIGSILGFIGQTGDLFISALKRRAGAKDTGTLIPGHGGLLDRIDALMLVSPAFLSFVVLWVS